MEPAPDRDIDENDLRVDAPKTWAAGVAGVTVSVRRSWEQMGPIRTVRTWRRLNQVGGFDCPGCAWPEPAKRKTFELCESGVKAVAEEATRRRVTPAFFAQHPVSELEDRTDYWLGQQGRLTHPMIRRPDTDHYVPIGWGAALDLIAEELRALDRPDDAVFYTSGRTSNEAAFLYQLFVRAFGTNNLPDCSNMCHEPTSVALAEAIGIGKGSVSLDDIHHTDLLILVGQNPGTNHPRMLSALQEAKDNGARIIAVNPLPEAGLMRFKDPQRVNGVVGRGTELADLHLPVRLGGDQALFAWLNRMLLERDIAGSVDRAFIDRYTTGYEDLATHLAGLDPEMLAEAAGLTTDELEAAFAEVVRAPRIIVCWAMGVTQHAGAESTIRELVNFALLGGHIGRPGAGLCPVRGHSNVQGNRTMGIWERPTPAIMDGIERRFGFAPPRGAGLGTVAAVRAMAAGRIGVFFGLGGNFARAAPDSLVTEAAMRSCALTVQVSTKLNRSHVVGGRTAVILPTLGRTELDVQRSGPQFVTVEDSMSMVHSSQGRLPPAAPTLLSEVAIVTRLAQRTLGPDPSIDWDAYEGDYGLIRDAIGEVIPGFHAFNARVGAPGGFVLPHPPRDERRFPTSDGRAHLHADALRAVEVPPGRLLLQTLRSHDQYNTTIYGLDDRYRGIHDGRRVVFINGHDLRELGLDDGQHVDVISEYGDGRDRRASDFRLVRYPTPRGCAAAYYPETNVLVSLDAHAPDSHTPAYKSIVVRLEPVPGPNG
ncbi:MAG TPA: FdhF/YdeP family oxidoreductase [Acidimicrobiales bacterium]